MTMTPDVSVVVISFNDAGRLSTAIASVQRQTLANLEIIVVDDASTDDTAQVVAEIAAHDARVRYERLPANSGGCSAPRNRGIELARAPWLMFCDSDDELERHAAKNLLQAAELHDADVVCGATYRQNPRSRTGRRWHPELHEELRVAQGLREFPELLYDTISVDKIYRADLVREHGLRFPEGILYEDQLFTLQAMALARRVVAIPETVYRWNVAPVDSSITRRRTEFRNVESRVAVNRLIDAFLARHADPVITSMKQRKFLDHDLRLYLESVCTVDDETADGILHRLRAYVAEQDLSAAWSLTPALRVALWHLVALGAQGRDCIRAATACAVDGTVGAPIFAEGDRERWGCEHLTSEIVIEGQSAREWLDVTSLHLRRIPVDRRRYAHALDSGTGSTGRTGSTGSTVDQCGDLDATVAPVLVVLRGRRTMASVPARWTSTRGMRWTWQADRIPALQAGEALHLVVQARQACNSSPVPVPVPSAAATSSRARKALRIARSEVGALAAMALGRLLPRTDMLLVESDAGRTCSGGVRVLAESVHAARPDLPIVWACAQECAEPPEWARRVDRVSWAHAWAAQRARWSIDDGTMARDLVARGTAVGVVAASPVHRVGLDDPSVLTSPAEEQEVIRRGRRWRRMILPSESDIERAPSAWAFSGTAQLGGPLRQAGARPALQGRASCGLDDGRAVVCWAPVPRADVRMDLHAWARELGDRAWLVAIDVPVPHELAWCIRAVADPDEATALMAQADVVMGDYGDRLVDAAAWGIPVVLYQPDRVSFVDRRHGLYPGMQELGAPLLDDAQMRDRVSAILDDLPAAREEQFPGLAAFARHHGAHHSVGSARLVALVLGGGS